jgi:hypothetical protein
MDLVRQTRKKMYRRVASVIYEVNGRGRKSWHIFYWWRKVQTISLKSKLCSRMLITVISKRKIEKRLSVSVVVAEFYCASYDVERVSCACIRLKVH